MTTPSATPEQVLPPPGTFERIAEHMLLGNPVRAWGIALVVAVGSLVAFNIARAVVAGRANRWAQRTDDSSIPDLALRLIGRTSIFAVIALSVWLGAHWLVLASSAAFAVRSIMVVALAAQAIIWGRLVVDFGLARFVATRRSADGQADPALESSMSVLRFLSLVALYAVVVLFALDNLGIDVTAMIAGLGIGGIAVALALQNILGDLFGSLSIVLDKPFVVGDFIIVGDKLGTVERIGLKTTRVRALSGEQLVFANTDLLASRIQNFKRMFERRVVFGLSVSRRATPEQLEQASRIIRHAIEAQAGCRFDRAHFKAFGSSSFDFEAVYYVLSPDFNVYMDRQQAINLHILRAFTEHGIELAYPAQTVILQPEAPAAAS